MSITQQVLVGCASMHFDIRSPRHVTSTRSSRPSTAGSIVADDRSVGRRRWDAIEELRVLFVAAVGPPGCGISIDDIIPISDGFKTASTARMIPW